MSSINDEEIIRLVEKLSTNATFVQTLLSTLATQTQIGDTLPESSYPNDFEPLPINRLSDVSVSGMHPIQAPYIGLVAQEYTLAHSSHIRRSAYHEGFVHDGYQTPSIRPSVSLCNPPECEPPGTMYQNGNEDPSGICCCPYPSGVCCCPYTCHNQSEVDHYGHGEINPNIWNHNAVYESTYKISDFNRHHDSTAHEDDLSELTPQVPLKNNSVHTTTTYKCSFAFQTSCNNNNQDAMSHCASRTSSENGIDSSFNSSEWNLDALYGMPTIDEFQDYYTDDDLPEYAIVLGSTVSSHNRRAASRAYRDARGANNTALSVVFERLLSHFSDKGVASYNNKFPNDIDQLLFVRIADRSDPNNTMIKFKPLSDRSSRDDGVRADIRLNGKRSPVDILKTLIDQKRRDLDTLHPAPQISKKVVFTNHLNDIKTLIENEVQDEMSINQYKLTIETMWDLYFTTDRSPKKRGRPKKDCSVIIDGNVCSRSIVEQTPFRITIRSFTGKCCIVWVERSDTVADVKVKLSRSECIPFDKQILITNNFTMDDNRTLECYNITSESIIHLVLHSVGGGDVDFVHYTGNGFSKGNGLNFDDDWYTRVFQAGDPRTSRHSCIIATTDFSSSETATDVDMVSEKKTGCDHENNSDSCLDGATLFCHSSIIAKSDISSSKTTSNADVHIGNEIEFYNGNISNDGFYELSYMIPNRSKDRPCHNLLQRLVRRLKSPFRISNTSTTARSANFNPVQAERVRPTADPPCNLPYYSPNDLNFTPSINGRSGWNFQRSYDIGEELGRGAFATVYKATHRMAAISSSWRNVAIKQTRPNALDLRDGRVIRSYDDLELYCEEIKVLIHLQQGSPTTSNVLQLYEYYLRESDIYVITELLDQDLDIWRQECEVFTERMAIDISRSILSSLKFISERNVVHRDIKLQNILFKSSNVFKSLKLVDFGLSRILGENEQVRDFCGSVGYIAPEIYAGKSYRFEVDMFAFGVLLFRLLSAERPFPHTNSQILRRHTLEFRYNVIGPAWENVSHYAKDLVRKLLINRDERLTAEQALAHPWFSADLTTLVTDLPLLNTQSLAHSEGLELVGCQTSLVPTLPTEKLDENFVALKTYEQPRNFRKLNIDDVHEKRSIARARCENDGQSILQSIVQRFQNHITVNLRQRSIDSAATSTPSSFDGSNDGMVPPVGKTGTSHRRAVSFCITPSTKTPPTTSRRNKIYGRSIIYRIHGSPRFQNLDPVNVQQSSVDSSGTSKPSSFDGSNDGIVPPVGKKHGSEHRRAMSFCITPSTQTPPTTSVSRRNKLHGHSIIRRSQG